MSRLIFAWLVVFMGSLTAACAADPAEPRVLEFCEGSVSFTWDPALGERLNAFPDDTYTTPDASTQTGRRVHLTESSAPWLANQASPAAVAYDALNALDGWGTSSALFLRFDGAL